MNINSLVEEYLNWNEREKWLVLRHVAYNRLRNILFSSPETVDNISEPDFRKDYLSFGNIVINNYEYKLTVNTIPRFLNRFTVSKLNEMAKSKEIDVIGNASWSQLHMGFRKNRWQQVKDGIKYLLFGETNTPLNEIEETKAYERLGRVLQYNLSIPGFGRAKVTPLLLICDKKNRFGVWNSVSEEALHKLKLKQRTAITKSRMISEYIRANEQFNYLKNQYGFNDLADVDLFLWYVLSKERGNEPELPEPEPSGGSNNLFKEICNFEKEIRAFIRDNLFNNYSDMWIFRVPKEARINWEKRRHKDKQEGKEPEKQMIDYADFADYKEIIFFNWRNIFYHHFKDKEKMRVKLEDLKQVRNLCMHGRTLNRDEIGSARIAIKWLRSRMNSI